MIPAEKDQPPLFGQVQHTLGERSAHLSFIFPDNPEPHPGLLKLLDELTVHAGQMGAANILAEVNDTNPSFEVLRRSGFSTYCWESVWKLPGRVDKSSFEEFTWEPIAALDESAVHTLYQTLVPPLVQSAEPFNGDDVRRLVVRNNGDLVAYVECLSGPKGVYLKPILHPAAPNPLELLQDLIKLFQGLGRPVYMQMRSYQAWLTPLLESLNAEVSVHFALMIRHLAVAQFNPATSPQLRVASRHTEPTASIVQKMVEPPK